MIAGNKTLEHQTDSAKCFCCNAVNMLSKLEQTIYCDFEVFNWSPNWQKLAANLVLKLTNIMSSDTKDTTFVFRHFQLPRIGPNIQFVKPVLHRKNICLCVNNRVGFRSSAYNLHCVLSSKTVTISLIYDINKSGPRQEPWITSLVMSAFPESVPPTSVTCILRFKKSCIHLEDFHQCQVLLVLRGVLSDRQYQMPWNNQCKLLWYR